MIHTICTLPRDSQDDKILPKHDEFNIQVWFCNNIQATKKEDEHNANIF